MDSNLFVSADTERSDGVTGLRENWGLARQLLQHLGGSGQPVTALADTNVQAEFTDLQVPHGVFKFYLSNHG